MAVAEPPRGPSGPIPPDNLPQNVRESMLAAWPKEPEHDIDMLHLEFHAWLAVEGYYDDDWVRPVPRGFTIGGW